MSQFHCEDKEHWHSRCYEVKSGTLIAPNMPPAQDITELPSPDPFPKAAWSLYRLDLFLQ